MKLCLSKEFGLDRLLWKSRIVEKERIGWWVVSQRGDRWVVSEKGGWVGSFRGRWLGGLFQRRVVGWVVCEEGGWVGCL